MNNLPRSQHIIASGVIAVVGIWIAYISYTQEPAAAFLFPRMISTVFVVLALWTFGKALLGKSKVGVGLSKELMLNLLPGLIIAGIYAMFLAKALGFYTATALTVFVLLSRYEEWTAADDQPLHWDIPNWIVVSLLAVVANFICIQFTDLNLMQTVLVVAVVCFYNSQTHRNFLILLKHIAITAVFVSVMFNLFGQLLSVFTPREILF